MNIMMYNPYIYGFYPYDPVVGSMPREYFNKPPQLYKIMQSMVNFNNENQVKISELAKNARTHIFDFDYPLSSKITREYFETMILNHFITRRIGFETMTTFKLKLFVKLNEIMPRYNMLFDAMDGWNLFDGESNTSGYTDNKRINNSTQTNDTSTSNSTNNITQDLRHSELPQNEIQDVKDGDYMTDYNFNNNQQTSNATASGNSNGTSETTEIFVHSANDNKTVSNKTDEYMKMIQAENIFTMIFKDLESLFYQLY